MSDQRLDTLRTATTQFTDLVGSVSPEDLTRQTPCTEWRVADLLDHAQVCAAGFGAMARGEEPDWSTPAPATDDRPGAVQRAVSDLFATWEQAPSSAPAMAIPEYAVHTWDLATALGRSTSDLDQSLAEQALSFLHQGLTDDNRGGSFKPEQPAPEGANAYDRLAAFAGRTVPTS